MCWLKIDMVNVFNNCSRSSFLRCIHQEFSSLFAWVQWCYHCQGERRFGDDTIYSHSGVQQGDPLGPLLFLLVVTDLLDTIDPFLNLHLQLWYLDDSTFFGLYSDVASFLEQIQVKGSPLGLQLNLNWSST